MKELIINDQADKKDYIKVTESEYGEYANLMSSEDGYASVTISLSENDARHLANWLRLWVQKKERGTQTYQVSLGADSNSFLEVVNER